jgi:hypothetical protein
VVLRIDASTAMIGECDDQRIRIILHGCDEAFERAVERQGCVSVLRRHPSVIVTYAVRVWPVQEDQATMLRGETILRRVENVVGAGAHEPKVADAKAPPDRGCDASKDPRLVKVDS